MTEATRDEVCVVAVAECFRGDGELLCNPIGAIPMIGGRLAREMALKLLGESGSTEALVRLEYVPGCNGPVHVERIIH